MKIVVIGGAGFIGSHIVEYYQNKSQKIIILDKSPCQKENALNINDKKSLKKRISGADYVFHMAATMFSGENHIETNIKGLINVLDVCVEEKIKKVFFASSASVYGDEGFPISEYGLSKFVGEDILKMYKMTYGLEFAAFRFYNVFGEGQNDNFIQNLISCLQNDTTLSVFGDGNQVRDFIYVKDVVAAMDFCLENDLSGIFDVGYSQPRTLNDIISFSEEVFGKKVKINNKKTKKDDIKISICGNTKLKEMGWQPIYDLDEALKIFLKSQKNL